MPLAHAGAGKHLTSSRWTGRGKYCAVLLTGNLYPQIIVDPLLTRLYQENVAASLAADAHVPYSEGTEYVAHQIRPCHSGEIDLTEYIIVIL